jgi:hypothetical protein
MDVVAGQNIVRGFEPFRPRIEMVPRFLADKEIPPVLVALFARVRIEPDLRLQVWVVDVDPVVEHGDRDVTRA